MVHKVGCEYLVSARNPFGFNQMSCLRCVEAHYGVRALYLGSSLEIRALMVFNSALRPSGVCLPK